MQNSLLHQIQSQEQEGRSSEIYESQSSLPLNSNGLGSLNEFCKNTVSNNTTNLDEEKFKKFGPFTILHLSSDQEDLSSDQELAQPWIDSSSISPLNKVSSAQISQPWGSQEISSSTQSHNFVRGQYPLSLTNHLNDSSQFTRDLTSTETSILDTMPKLFRNQLCKIDSTQFTRDLTSTETSILDTMPKLFRNQLCEIGSSYCIITQNIGEENIVEENIVEENIREECTQPRNHPVLTEQNSTLDAQAESEPINSLVIGDNLNSNTPQVEVSNHGLSITSSSSGSRSYL
jgi:hypothetical protein